MIDKCLVVISTHNAPSFLDCFINSLKEHDAGYPHDVLIWDCDNTDPLSLFLLEQASKTHIVRKRPNTGRAQGGYQAACQIYPDYKYYFFMHDDSAIIQDNWLLDGINRMKDSSVEPGLPEHIAKFPVGKVGYSSYEWGTLDKYFRTGHPAIFRFLRPLLEAEPSLVGDPDKLVFQHIADDKVLYTNECLKSMLCLANIEMFRTLDGACFFPAINDWFAKNYPGRGFIEPKERYNGACWEGYQTWCEFMNDILPVSCGFRTHNLVGDGYSQEELKYDSFWGNEKVIHWGAHNVFKRLSILECKPEEMIRSAYGSIMLLKYFTALVKKDVNSSRHSNA